MPNVGAELNFTPHSLATEVEVAAAIRAARSSAIKTFLTLVLGDPAWIGSKRACFRIGDLCAIPSDPESLSLVLTPGSAAMNDGENHNGNWHLVYAVGKTITFDVAHASLDRYDILCAAPKRVPTGAVQREVVDAQGNVSLMTDHEFLLDDFDLTIIKGVNGAAAPDIYRLNAWEFVAPGLIPISRVRIRGGASTILISDLVDLRELFIPRNYPIGLELPEHVITLLGGTIPANQWAQPHVLMDGAMEANIPRDHFFIDKSAGSPGVLKYKFDDDSIFTFGAATP